MTGDVVVTMPIIGRFPSWAERDQHLVDWHHITEGMVDRLDSQEARDYHTYLHTNAGRHGRRHVHRGGM